MPDEKPRREDDDPRPFSELLQDRSAPAAEIVRLNRGRNSRARRATSRIHQRLIDNAAPALDIDLAQLDRLHEREAGSLRRHLASMWPRVDGLIQARARRQEANRDTAKRIRRELYAGATASGAGSGISVFLCHADIISFHDSWLGDAKLVGEFTHSPGVGGNLLENRFSIGVNAKAAPWNVAFQRSGMAVVYVSFKAYDLTPGTYDLVVFIEPNGGYTLYAPKMTCASRPYAEVDVGARVSTRQYWGDHTLEMDGGRVKLAEEIATESSPIWSDALSPLVDHIETSPIRLPVNADEPLDILVEFYIEVTAEEGGEAFVQADINVPMVWLTR